MTRLLAWARPAVGGLVTGVLAVLAVATLGARGVTGGGYAALSQALDGRLTLQVMAALFALKMVATVFSYSSGGAGGIFAPVLFIGAMLGGSVGYLDRVVLGHADAPIGAFALVGMGAVFAGTIRAPITSVLIIFEMTAGYGLVLPLMIANTTSYVIARRFRPTPIYEALIEQDGARVPHGQRMSEALAQLLVGDAMTREVVSLPADATVSDALRRIRSAATGFASYPLIDGDGRYVEHARRRRVRASNERGGV
jgi:CIC family chloride channel protein